MIIEREERKAGNKLERECGLDGGMGRIAKRIERKENIGPVNMKRERGGGWINYKKD